MKHEWCSKSNAYFFWVMLLAATVRLFGLHHGYPYSYYPDEAHFVKRALSFGSFDFNPHWFHKPAFYMYILFFEYGVYFILGKIVGLWHSTADFAVSYVRNPGPFYMIGRVTTVLFSLGSVWVTYIIGERHFKNGVGLIAALLLSLSFGHVVASQDVKADTPTMFFTIASMLFLLNYVTQCQKKFLYLAVISAGMGTATKTYSIVMLAPIMASVAIVHHEKISNFKILIRHFLLDAARIIGIFFGVYFICSPYNFLDPLGREATFGDIFRLIEKIGVFFGTEKIARPGDFIGERTSIWGGAVDYLRVLFSPEGMGIMIASLCILGVLLTFKVLNKQSVLLLVYPLLFGSISVFIAPGYADTRHQLPLYPFLVIFGGIFVAQLTNNKIFSKRCVYGVLFVSLIFPLLKIVERGYAVSKPDTRNIAKEWIENNIPSGAKILLDENGVQLLSDEISLRKNIEEAENADSKGQFTAHYGTYLKYQLMAAEGSVSYDIEFIRFPWWRESFEETGPTVLDSEYDSDMANPLRPVGVDTYQHYIKKGIQFVVVHSGKYQPFMKENSKKREKFPPFYTFYKTLFEQGTLVKEFLPSDLSAAGPTVKIFKTKDTPL